jgi:hypothetical protein
MDVLFYLSLKKSYEKIKNNLENIIYSYNEINYISTSNKKFNNKPSVSFEINDDLINYKKKLENICLTIKIINNLLFINCDHNFIEDTIDITPDKSKSIIYCSICECSKN